MPKRTLELLDSLQSLGFTEDNFTAIHHFRENASIEAHRYYCRKTGSFTSDTNNDVRRRLELIYTLFRAANFTHREDPRAMNLLIELANIEYPVVLAAHVTPCNVICGVSSCPK